MELYKILINKNKNMGKYDAGISNAAEVGRRAGIEEEQEELEKKPSGEEKDKLEPLHTGDICLVKGEEGKFVVRKQYEYGSKPRFGIQRMREGSEESLESRSAMGDELIRVESAEERRRKKHPEERYRYEGYEGD